MDQRSEERYWTAERLAAWSACHLLQVAPVVGLLWRFIRRWVYSFDDGLKSRKIVTEPQCDVDHKTFQQYSTFTLFHELQCNADHPLAFHCRVSQLRGCLYNNIKSQNSVLGKLFLSTVLGTMSLITTVSVLGTLSPFHY